MGDLDRDTAVTGGDGRYTATLAEDWRIWGPMGGYVASIALRACAAEIDATLPVASFTCQFLSSARFEPVDVSVDVRRATSRTALVVAQLTQEGRPALDAQTWFAAPSTVVEHDHAAPHRYGRPEDHTPIDLSGLDLPPMPFWDNFDRKLVDWVEDWEGFPGGDPEWAEWVRYLPTTTFDDPVLEACRLVLLADLPSFPAAIRAYPASERLWIAPSLDLSVQLHHLDDLGEWLLVHGSAPIAGRGLLGFRSEVWTATGRMVASGAGQLLVRPLPPGMA